MAKTILPSEVAAFLESETAAALDAASRIPGEAAKAAWEFLLGPATPVYSGAYRAALRIGIEEVPSIPESLRNITDALRNQLHRAGRVYEPQPSILDAEEVADEFEEGDTIVISNNIRYAQRVEEKENFLITERAQNVAERALANAIGQFNRRSAAARRGASRRR